MGLWPGPRWGSIQRSPRPPSWFKEALLLRREKGKEGRVKKKVETSLHQFFPEPLLYNGCQCTVYVTLENVCEEGSVRKRAMITDQIQAGHQSTTHEIHEEIKNSTKEATS